VASDVVRRHDARLLPDDEAGPHDLVVDLLRSRTRDGLLQWPADGERPEEVARGGVLEDEDVLGTDDDADLHRRALEGLPRGAERGWEVGPVGVGHARTVPGAARDRPATAPRRERAA